MNVPNSDLELAVLRSVAFAIDGFLLAVCYFFVFVIGASFFFFFAIDLNGDLWLILFLLFMGLMYVLWILYFVVPTVFLGQSLGKRLLGIRIIPADGTQLYFARMLVRESLKLFSITSMIGIVLNAAEIACFQDTWYDRLCGTILIRVPPKLEATSDLPSSKRL